MVQSLYIVILMFGLIFGGCGSGGTDAPAEPVATPPQPSASARSARVMPLGDSITESAAGHSSYRYYLWHSIIGRGYDVDFVGSQYGVSGGAPKSGDFDMNHEGHWGWTTDQILAQIQGWATNASPDFVLIHLGHNDLGRAQDIPGTVNELGQIIDRLRIVNPRIGIVLAQIISPVAPGLPQLPAFNAQLPALVAAKNQEASPIVLVDQYTGFDPYTMTWDGGHPNEIGEAQMADRWLSALAPLLDHFFASL